jgi:hypothetical protein
VQGQLHRFLEHNQEKAATLRQIAALLWACSNLK